MNAVSERLVGSRHPLPDPIASTALNAARRQRELDELAAGREVDLLVIGGGITGTGVALDAATRGLTVALVERRDLAHGTSRWSSKLVHGGLRYLAQGAFGLAWESAVERAVLLRRTAPHLTRALPFLVPLGDEVRGVEAALTELGVRVGDAMRALTGTSNRRLPAPRRISAEEAWRLAPGLETRGLRGAVQSWDAQLEDDARLVIAVARSAAAFGARILTYVGAEQVGGGGAMVRDERTGRRFELRARHVVNATGVWAGELDPQIELRPSKGSHVLVAAGRLGDPRAALTVPVPGASGRWVFALPRPDGLVAIGLTDDEHPGPVPDEPTVSDAERRFLLDTVSSVLRRPLGAADVVGAFAGLRPLLAGSHEATADLSRRHAVLEAPDSQMLTIVGGKLTTYRLMAEDVVDRIAARPGVAAGPCVTERLPLVGATDGQRWRAAGVPSRLLRRYGAEACELHALAESEPPLGLPLVPDGEAIGAEVRFACERELALDPADVVDRRLRLGLVDAWRDEALEAVAASMAPPVKAAA